MSIARQGARRGIDRAAFRSILLHAALFAAVAVLVAVASHLLGARLTRQGIRTGFAYLWDRSTVPVSDSLFADPAHPPSFAGSLLSGALNTLLVTAAAILAASVLGATVGLLQTAPVWLLARALRAYVELVRNVPALLHIVFWYAVLRNLPPPRRALHPLGGAILSNRGLRVPVPLPGGAATVAAVMVLLLAASLAAVLLRRRWPRARGRILPGAALISAASLWWALGASGAWDVPRAQGLGFVGGANLSIEFVGLLTALSIYYSSYIAEIVRAGILSVPAAQREAATALGLPPGRTLRLVIAPQALRAIAPQLPNEYVGILKTSSLAVAIGYQEMATTTATVVNNTGQAIEPILLLAVFYLAGSALLSLVLNGWAARSLGRAYR